jgi:hypothetical protein
MLERDLLKKIGSLTISISLITLILFVLIPPATAVKILPGTPDCTLVNKGTIITFDNVNLTIRSNERIPVEFLNFSIFNDSSDQLVAYLCFSINSTILSQSPSGSFTVTNITNINALPYGTGSSFGYDENDGTNHSFGYGYGYADSGYTDINILYSITYETQTAGTFYAKLFVNSSTHTYISSKSSTFTVHDVWWNTSWLYAKKITIDHTKIAANLTNFPVLISSRILSQSYVYAAGATTQKIYQYWSPSMAKNAESASGGASTPPAMLALTYDGTYVYAALPFPIRRINQYWASNMTLKKQSDAVVGDPQCLTQDSDYVYAGFSNQRYVVKFQKSDMTNVGHTAAVADVVYSVTCDDTYLYAYAYNVATGYKINQYWKSNLTLKASSSASYGGIIYTIAQDSTYVYAGGASANTVRQYWKSNMTYKTQTESYGGTIKVIAQDDTYLYVGGINSTTTANARVKQYWKSNMTKKAETTVYGGDIQTITQDGTFLYVAGTNSTTATNTRVKQYWLTNMTKKAETATYGGIIYALCSDTYIELKAQIDGDDFVFVDSTNTTKYNHEIERWDPAAGNLTAWVNVTSLSNTTDTIMYLYYGNPTCTSQQNKYGTWDSDYLMVLHMNGASYAAISDSTSNKNNVTGTIGTCVYQQTGKTGYAVLFSLTALTLSSPVRNTPPITVEAWAKPTTIGSSNYVLSNGAEGGGKGFAMSFDSGTGRHYLVMNNVTNSKQTNINSGTSSTGTWYYYGMTWSGVSADNGTFFVQNTKSIATPTAASPSGNYNLTIGINAKNKNYAFVGYLDEMRISKVVRSDGWLTTSYNTQNSPSTFMSLSAEMDKRAPVVVITTPAAGAKVKGTATVSFTDDELTNPQCSIDNSVWVTCTSGVTTLSSITGFDDLPEGSFTLYLRDIDASGNIGTDRETGIIKDTTSPTVAITYSDADALVKADDSLTITATFNENMADSPLPKIAINGSETITATDMTKVGATVYTYTHTVGVGNGIATVTLSVGTDSAGNVVTSTPTSGATYTVDNIAPITAITTPLTSTLVTGMTIITFTDSELTDAQCSVDNSSWVACTSGVTTLSNITGFDALDQGAFTLYLKDIDLAGNTGMDSESGIIKDTIPPIVVLTSEETSPTKESPIHMIATFSENVTGFIVDDITVTNGAVSNFTAVNGTVYTFDITPAGQGVVTVDIAASVAQDAAFNNNSAATQFSITYDTVGPVTSITVLSTYKNADFTVQWSVAGETSGVGSWTVQSREDAGGWSAWLTNVSYTMTSAMWSISNTTEGHTVSFRALAVDNASNCGAWSASVSTIRDSAAPVTTISALSAYQTTNFDVDWSAIEVTSGVASWTIQSREDAGAWSAWLTNVSYTIQSANWDIDNTTNGHTVSFRALAVDNASNCGTWSNVVNTSINATRPVTTITPLSTYATSAFTVQWSAVNATLGVGSWTVQSREDAGAWSTWLTNVSYTMTSATWLISNTTEGHTVSFRALAVDNTSNCGAWSASVSTIRDSAAPVTTISALSAYQTTNFDVDWSAIEVTSGVASWTVQYKENSSGNWTAWYTNVSYTIRSAVWDIDNSTENCTVYFRVLAVDNASNCGVWSSVVNTTKDTIDPVLSSVSSGTPSATSATITWTSNEDATSNVKYGLGTSYGTWSNSSTYTTSHLRTLTSLSSSTTYHYQVVSYDQAGNAANSTDYTFTTESNGGGGGGGSSSSSPTPVAEAAGPYSGYVNVLITFDGSSSTEVGGAITGYRWDWTNDGTYDTNWSTSATATHAYTTVGSYTVRLQVKDSSDVTATDTAAVTITMYPGIKASQAILATILTEYGIHLTNPFYANDTNGDGVVDTFTDPNHRLLVVRFVNISDHASFLLSTNNVNIPEFFWDTIANTITSVHHSIGTIIDTVNDTVAKTMTLTISVEKANWTYFEVSDSYPENRNLLVKTIDGRTISDEMIWRETGMIFILDDPETEYQLIYSYTQGSLFDVILELTPDSVQVGEDISALITLINVGEPGLVNGTVNYTLYEGEQIVWSSEETVSVLSQKTYTKTLSTKGLSPGSYTYEVIYSYTGGQTASAQGIFTVNALQQSLLEDILLWIVIIIIIIVIIIAVLFKLGYLYFDKKEK